MKKVPIVVAYQIEQEVPDDWDDDTIRFCVEENTCLDNHVTKLQERVAANPTICQTCSIGRAMVGVTLEEIAAAHERGGSTMIWEDAPLPEDDAISAAHPLSNGRHDLYNEAMRMVGAKRSKRALVALVNWLLTREDVARGALGRAVQAFAITGPPHPHEMPGVWDGRGGRPCHRCREWHASVNAAREAFAALPPRSAL